MFVMKSWLAILGLAFLLPACGANIVTVRDNNLQVQKEAFVKKDWNEATAYCGNIGMRLPTKDELLHASKRGVRVWAVPKGNYWTSTLENDKPCIIATSFGISNCGEIPKSNRNQLTRCVK